MPGDVRSVDGGGDSFAASERADFFGRENDSCVGGDVAEEYYAGSRRDCFAEEIQDLLRILHRLWQSDFLYYDSVALGAQVKWMLAAGVLLIGH
jgi:hypothetical protein